MGWKLVAGVKAPELSGRWWSGRQKGALMTLRRVGKDTAVGLG